MASTISCTWVSVQLRISQSFISTSIISLLVTIPFPSMSNRRKAASTSYLSPLSAHVPQASIANHSTLILLLQGFKFCQRQYIPPLTGFPASPRSICQSEAAKNIHNFVLAPTAPYKIQLKYPQSQSYQTQLPISFYFITIGISDLQISTFLCCRKLSNKLMKQAQRVYLKHRAQHRQHESPFFKSSVQRSMLDPLPNRDPGPGSYEVTLPLAIFKNNRSIIIKVNDIPVPAFASREARFKQYSTIDSKKDDDALDLRELEKLSPNRIKNSRRYNFSMARKKSIQSISFTTVLTNNQNSFDSQIIKKKGAEWSKYRQQRRIWLKDANNPGPGAYDGLQKIQKPVKKSWQFRSETKRSYSEKRRSQANTMEIPEVQKINSIHSRQNLLQVQY